MRVYDICTGSWCRREIWLSWGLWYVDSLSRECNRPIVPFVLLKRKDLVIRKTLQSATNNNRCSLCRLHCRFALPEDFVDTTLYAHAVLLPMPAIELYGASVVMSMTVVAMIPLALTLVIPLVIPLVMPLEMPLEMRLTMPLASKFA